MPTPADNFLKYLKEQLAKFEKSPLMIPVVIAIAAGVEFLTLTFAPTFCLSGLIAPLVLLGLLWRFNVKKVLRLLEIGAIACAVFSGVWILVFTDSYQHITPGVAVSEDGTTLTEGMLTPLYGDTQTTFHYTLTVRLNNTTVPVRDINVMIGSVGFPASTTINYTMTEIFREVNKSVGTKTYTFVHYDFNTTLSTPINQYVFWANVDNGWFVAADYSQPQAQWLLGPVSKDTAAVAGAFTPIGFFQIFTQNFPVYALILLMIWWTRRARRMREEQYKKWEEERSKEEAKVPTEKGKVESKVNLREAMGMETGGGFVCSECGADVPADATVCPKCGEKFE